MFKFTWRVFKSVFGILFTILRPLQRLFCRRQKLSKMEGVELTSIGSGDMPYDSQYSLSKSHIEEIEPETWDTWDDKGEHSSRDQSAAQRKDQAQRGYGTSHNYHYNKKLMEPEPEEEVNFFEDMTPQVKRQPKILIRKKDAAPTSFPYFSDRLGVLSDVPLANSELEAWEDESNAWETEEASEDLSWQAQEAIKEKKRLERLERQMEQQKKKQKKEEMRGLKTGSLIATKLS
ncbi:unnamed protein product [Lymnaea stagnalis]|uniref:Receptor-binding cancer antigen expressed on SiSo cells n=1 Tax=Lymnaea stagnalis TaxID=6523 RepID=A0AAV2HWY8_LYMST